MDDNDAGGLEQEAEFFTVAGEKGGGNVMMAHEVLAG